MNVIEDKKHYHLHVKKKMRLIDPSVYVKNEFITASILSNKIKVMCENAYEKAQEGTYVRLISN